MVPWAQPHPQLKRHLNWFSCFCIAHGRASLCFTMGRPFPFKIALCHGRSGPHLIHDFLGPSKPTTQVASRSVLPFFEGLTTVIDRQTDRSTDHANQSVTISYIYVRSTAIRCNNNKNNQSNNHNMERGLPCQQLIRLWGGCHKLWVLCRGVFAPINTVNTGDTSILVSFCWVHLMCVRI